MLPVIISIVLLIGSATQTLALPQTTGTATPPPAACIQDAGPFKLFANRTDTGALLPVRLSPTKDLPLGGSGTNTSDSQTAMTLDLNEECTNCGVIPPSWRLEDMTLFPDVGGPRHVTVNENVTLGSLLTFETIFLDLIPSVPVYCGVSNNNSNQPSQLSVNGIADQFFMCTPPTAAGAEPTFFEIYFGFPQVAVSCDSITLVLQ